MRKLKDESNYIEEKDPAHAEKEKFRRSLLFPLLFIAVLWIIKMAETAFELDLAFLGIFPRSIKGLPGIITSPFIHGSYKHLFNNTFPLLFLSVTLFYFYRPIHFKIFIYSFVFTGICVWAGARPAYHIGASGLIYGLAAFLFLSGIIRNSIRLMAISLIVTFLYGSMIWGILPLNERISWESHLWGAISGVALAIIYRKHGPQRISYEWEWEETEEEENEDINNQYFS